MSRGGQKSKFRTEFAAGSLPGTRAETGHAPGGRKGRTAAQPPMRAAGRHNIYMHMHMGFFKSPPAYPARPRRPDFAAKGQCAAESHPAARRAPALPGY